MYSAAINQLLITLLILSIYTFSLYQFLVVAGTMFSRENDVRFVFHPFVLYDLLMLFVFLYDCWCQPRFPCHMIFVQYTSNNIGYSSETNSRTHGLFIPAALIFTGVLVPHSLVFYIIVLPFVPFLLAIFGFKCRGICLCSVSEDER